MKAVRLAEARRLELVEMDRPEPGPGEALLRIEACGVCGSDLTSFKLGLSSGVLGHEVAATVEVGADGFSPGDLVTIDPKLPCGECAECRAGRENRCIDTLTKQTFEPGGFAEWAVAPASILTRLPDGLAPEVGALAEPLSVAVHAVAQARVQPGGTVLVSGLGSIGLLTVVALKAAGAGTILAVEPSPERRELGEMLGATRTAASAGEALSQFDRVATLIECSGRGEALARAIDLTAGGGRIVLAGIPVAEVTFVPVFLITREITLTGSICATRDEFAEAVALLPSHPELADITQPRLGLDDVPAAFEAIAEGHVYPGKPLVTPRI
ncbi:MAG TPA: alcohol dehydrogenase catalytic domain-containing protein [Solirubrobacterales bacterium]|nr:alcohol dehydrogenase catalytic domain-containing protein [Solirubrobacterales bacterium]